MRHCRRAKFLLVDPTTLLVQNRTIGTISSLLVADGEPEATVAVTRASWERALAETVLHRTPKGEAACAPDRGGHPGIDPQDIFIGRIVLPAKLPKPFTSRSAWPAPYRSVGGRVQVTGAACMATPLVALPPFRTYASPA